MEIKGNENAGSLPTVEVTKITALVSDKNSEMVC